MKLSEICNLIAVKSFEIGDIIQSSIPDDMCAKFFRIVDKTSSNISVVALEDSLERNKYATPGWVGRPSNFFKPKCRNNG